MKKTIEIGGAIYTLPFSAGMDDMADVIVDAKHFWFGSFPHELEYIAAALNDYRPWRYTEDGERPTIDTAYEVTLGNDTIEKLRWTGADWIDRNGFSTGYVRAFRELPSTAPERKKQEANDGQD